MNKQEALDEIPDIDTFCRICCDRCTGNDYYCPSECDTLTKARKLDFDRIVNCYAKHDGDLNKVKRYIDSTPIIRLRGGY